MSRSCRSCAHIDYHFLPGAVQGLHGYFSSHEPISLRGLLYDLAAACVDYCEEEPL